MKTISLVALAAFFLVGANSTTFAQTRPNEPCLLDRCGDREPPGVARTAPAERDSPQYRAPSSVAPGNFDFYVLALSWSASFCALEGTQKGREQCAPGAANGFVVHGLWPQNERGFPSNCEAGARNPPRAAMDIARAIFPEEGLARHQWRKHGTCSGRSPSEYFAETGRARDKIVIPEEFKAPGKAQSFAPMDVQRAFLAANRGLRPGMMAVTCQRGLLQEVRVCLSKDLREFQACPEVARQACRAREISAPPAL
jgi:ribonuclease T2